MQKCEKCEREMVLRKVPKMSWEYSVLELKEKSLWKHLDIFHR